MGSDRNFVDFVLEQAAGAGELVCKPMFGEYGLYLDGKLTALVCDDQLYLKPTRAGAAKLGTPREEPPYQGAKPYYLVEELEDGEWLAELLRVSAAELPAPRPRKPRKKSRGK